MKNKLFLSLSLLTMAFSQVNANVKIAFDLAKAYASLYKVEAAKTGAFAGMVGYLYNQSQKDQAQATELNRRAEKLAKAKMIGAQMAEEKANIEAGVALQTTRMQRVQKALNNAGSYVANTRAANALVKAGSVVKSNVQAHPRIATGAGLVTLAGLSYAAYNKFGKAVKKTTVKASTPVVKTEVKKTTPVVATPVKKAKKALKGGYARRK